MTKYKAFVELNRTMVVISIVEWWPKYFILKESESQATITELETTEMSR